MAARDLRRLFPVVIVLTLASLTPELSSTKRSGAAGKEHAADARSGKVSASGYEAIAAAVDPERIRQHVRFLSLDLLEGRGTGQRGGDIAAEYIGTQFALYGLKPAGSNGSFLQKVPL